MKIKNVNQCIKKHVSSVKTMTVSGYAALFKSTPDCQGDIITQEAFVKSINDFKNANYHIPMLWNHNAQSPIGVWNQYRIDSKGLWVMGIIYMENEDATFVAKGVQNGYINGLSVGFTVDQSYMVKKPDYKRAVQVITEATLHEVSMVVMPANDIRARLDKEGSKMSE